LCCGFPPKAFLGDEALLGAVAQALARSVEEWNQRGEFVKVRAQVAARTFETPEEFLAYARAYAVGVAVLDVLMPGTTGIEVQERLREISPGWMAGVHGTVGIDSNMDSRDDQDILFGGSV